MSNGQSLKSAWLITWESAGTEQMATNGEKVAAVLNSRCRSETVRIIVEQLYAATEYSAWDKLNAARAPKSNPYPAEFGRVNGAKWSGEVNCGHNPFLYARKVKDLRVVIEDDGVQRVSWNEIPRPKVAKSTGAQ